MSSEPSIHLSLLCQMQRNAHLSSNGGGNKGQAEPHRMKRARKNYHPQDRCLLSCSHFPSQFDLGNQMKVFHRTQGATHLLVSFFNLSSVYSQSIKTSVCWAETKISIESGGHSTSKNNEQLGYNSPFRVLPTEGLGTVA